MKPLLLVDVDGVLFPFDHSDAELRQCGGVETVPYTARMEARLRLLETQFTCTWATARFDDVHTTVAKMFGIGEGWPAVSFAGIVHRSAPAPGRARTFQIDGFRPGWKLDFVVRHLSLFHGPVAWIDDDVSEEMVEWALERRWPTLLCHVPPNDGLTDLHLEQLLDWKRSLTDG